MPIEVQYGHYLFLPIRKYSLEDLSELDSDDMDDPDPSSPAAESPSQSQAAVAPSPTSSPPATPSSPSFAASPAVSYPPPDEAHPETVLGKRGRGRRPTAADGAEPSKVALRLAEEAVPSEPTYQQYLPFHYNPLHDFESVVWICLYFIVDRVVVGHAQEQSPSDLEAQIRHARNIFSSSLVQRQQVYMTLSVAGYYSYIDEVINRLHPAVQGIGRIIRAMMSRLKSAYGLVEERELNTIARSAVALTFNGNMQECLTQIVKILEKEDVQCAPLPVIKVADNEEQDT